MRRQLGSESADCLLYLSDGAVNQVGLRPRAEVQLEVSILNLFSGDADVVQCLSRCTMAEDLLEEQQLAWVIVAHQHLVEGERLAERMCRNVDVEAKRSTDFLQNSLYRVAVHRGVGSTTSVTLSSEHIVTELHARCILQVEGDCIDHSIVDGDVSVLLNLPGVSRLLLKDGEGCFEPELIIDDVGEPEREQVADTEPEVDTNDEEHVVSVSPVGDEPV